MISVGRERRGVFFMREFRFYGLRGDSEGFRVIFEFSEVFLVLFICSIWELLFRIV